jgi:hypothetical protein
MAKFRLGGSGPDNRGLGKIAGIPGKRFDKAGEMYETDDLDEIQVLGLCPYAEAIAPNEGNDGETLERGNLVVKEKLKRKKMKELIKMGYGLYQVGMTKAELVDRIIAEAGYQASRKR